MVDHMVLGSLYIKWMEQFMRANFKMGSDKVNVLKLTLAVKDTMDISTKGIWREI